MPTKPAVKRETHKLDATDKSLGRLASEVATLLRGKQKRDFKLHIDMGDFVEISNLKKLKFTGNKLANEVRYRHTQYPGGLIETPLKTLWEKNPAKVFKHAVEGMLPKNKLRKEWVKRLKINEDGNGDSN